MNVGWNQIRNIIARRVPSGNRFGVPRDRRNVGIERLEDRCMMAIVWANELRADTNFGLLGADDELARQIVHRAIDDWNQTILDFNYDGDNDPDTENTFELFVGIFPFSGGTRGVCNVVEMADGKPKRAEIFLDNDGGGRGWFFDPTPGDDREFQDGIASPFHATTDLFDGASDFYRTIAHELGHAVGIDGDPGLRLRQFMTPQETDQVDGVSTLYLFHNQEGVYGSAGFVATLTGRGAVHVYEGPAQTLPSHPRDLLNAGRSMASTSTTRQLISDLDVKILVDAYGYTARLPSEVNSFFLDVDKNGTVVVKGVDQRLFVGIQDLGERVAFRVDGHGETLPYRMVNRVEILGDAILESGGTFSLKVGAAFPITVSGTLDLNDAELSVVPGDVSSIADAWLLIQNDSMAPVAGTFAGLPDGAVVRLRDTATGVLVPMEVDYDGGDGNDIELRRLETLSAARVDVAPYLSNRGAVEEIVYTFDETIADISLLDFELSRNGERRLWDGDTTLTTDDHVSWRLGNLESVTLPPGEYRVVLRAERVGSNGLGDTRRIDDVITEWTHDRIPGDANQDGRFDYLDIVDVLQRGKYRSELSATWEEGDWNNDGVFDQHDIVAALSWGGYGQS